MVNLLALVRQDFAGLAARAGLLRAPEPSPGLHTYEVEGGQKTTRLHLRVQRDGSALLFVDVTDVLHLTPSAAYMAWLALEKVPPNRAIPWMLARWHGVDRRRLTATYARIRRDIEALGRDDPSCRTCRLELERMPLFSLPAGAPHKADLALTYACNNACPHCYNDPGRFDLASLETDAWKRIIDRLAEVGVPHLIFTGGEATLHPGLPELVRHATGLGLVCGLNTNGRRLKHAEYTWSLYEAGLNHVQVTLHSHRPEVHDAMVAARSFEQTVAGIRTALETPLHVITNGTLTQANSGEIEETLTFLHDLGISTFALNGMIYSGGGDRNPDAIPQAALPPILVRVKARAEALGMRFLWYTVTEYCEMSPVELELGAKRCNAGEYSICIEPNGDVLPCQSYYVSAGNLLRDPWEQIWNGQLFREFRERDADPRWAGLPEKCWTCPDLPLCGGGCRIERESRAGKAPGGCQSCATGGVRSSGMPVARVCGGHTPAPENHDEILVRLGGCSC